MMLLGLVAVLALVPFASLLIAWLQPTVQAQAALSAPLGEYAWGSVRLISSVLLMALPLGAGCAWLVVNYNFPGRRWIDTALTLPLALPAYLLAIVYGQLLSSSGPLQSSLRDMSGLAFGEYWFPSIRSPGGAAFVLAFALYPYLYLLCRAAMGQQALSLTESARMLGLTARQAFWRVSLPLLRPALVGGAALVAMEALADFGVVSLYATPTFTTGIYRTMFGLGDPVMARRLAGVLVLCVLAALLAERHQRAVKRYHVQHTSDRQAIPVALHGTQAMLAFVVCLLPCFLGFLLPVGVLIVWALGDAAQWSDGLHWQAAWHSFTVGAVVAGVVTLLALLLAYAMRYQPPRWLRVMVQLAGAGYALPGLVIAVSIMLPLIAFDRQLGLALRTLTGESYGLLLTGTIGAVTLACTVRFLSLGLHTLDAGMQGLSPLLDMAARSLGASEAAVLRRVHWPLLRRSLAVSALLVFVDTMKELPATYLLRPFNYDTLAIRAFALASDEKYQAAAPAALMLTAAGVLAMVVLQRVTITKA